MLRQVCAAAIAAAVPLLAAQSAAAQSLDLGMTSGQLSFAVGSGEDALPEVSGSLDFKITAYHGLQLDLGALGYEHFWMGNVAGHLYMRPSETAKYGVFLAYSDANDEEASTSEAGVEGIWQLADRLAIEARAGVGRAQDQSEVDYTFGHVQGRFGLSDHWTLIGGAHFASIDEKQADYRLLGLDLGAAYRVAGGPFSVDLRAEQTWVSGAMDREDTRLVLGLSLDLGGRTRARPSTDQHFSPVRPLKHLIAQDAIWPEIATRASRADSGSSTDLTGF